MAKAPCGVSFAFGAVLGGAIGCGALFLPGDDFRPRADGVVSAHVVPNTQPGAVGATRATLGSETEGGVVAGRSEAAQPPE